MTAADVYADATSLIGLARIERLDLLSLLPTPVLVTDIVWQEVAGDPTRRGVTALLAARDAGLLRVVREGDPQLLPELDPGECSVVTAAAIAGGAVLIDERKARALVASHPDLKGRIPYAFGLIGLLLLAKRQGRIATVQPLLDALMNQGFWMSPEFRRRVLAQAGES
ncbi:MAG: DUF3368 domain-containing protein [Anaerolineae bacterium]